MIANLASHASYYTRPAASTALVQTLRQPSPKNLIDLGSGTGALTLAALDRWPRIEPHCLDISEISVGPTCELPKNVCHAKVDVLSSDLDQYIQDSQNKFDLVLSNPPFLRRSVNDYIKKIFLDAGLDDCLERTSTQYSTYSAFLAQSLRIASENSEVAVIVPESFVNGERYSRARAALAENYAIEAVHEFPPNSFQRTEAFAYALVIRKSSRASYTRLSSALSSKSFYIPWNKAETRLDHKYYLAASGRTNCERLGQFSFDVTRGRITSKKARSELKHFLHTSHLRGAAINGRGLYSETVAPLYPNQIYATTGDLVISRVGSRVIGDSAIVKGGIFPITDCIFRVRALDTHSQLLLDNLSITSVRDYLKSIAKGTCAKYLTLADIESIPF